MVVCMHDPPFTLNFRWVDGPTLRGYLSCAGVNDKSARVRVRGMCRVYVLMSSFPSFSRCFPAGGLIGRMPSANQTHLLFRALSSKSLCFANIRRKSIFIFVLDSHFLAPRSPPRSSHTVSIPCLTHHFSTFLPSSLTFSLPFSFLHSRSLSFALLLAQFTRLLIRSLTHSLKPNYQALHQQSNSNGRLRNHRKES